MFVVHCLLFIEIRFCCCWTYVYIAHFDIGFVLRNEAKFLILDTGCWMLDTRWWMVDGGWLMLDGFGPVRGGLSIFTIDD